MASVIEKRHQFVWLEFIAEERMAVAINVVRIEPEWS